MESNTFRGCICSLCTLWNFKEWIIKNILSNQRCRNLYSTSQNLWFHCDIPMKLGLFSGAQRKSRRNSSEKVCELSDQALCLASMQGMYLKNGSTRNLYTVSLVDKTFVVSFIWGNPDCMCNLLVCMYLYNCIFF